MTVVQNTLKDGAGGPVVGAVIQAALVGSGFLLDGSSQIVRSVSTVSGSDGSWSLNLTAQSLLEGSSYYVIREDGRAYTATIPVSATPVDLRDCLVDPPAVGLQEVGLSQAVADTLYEPLGGGGGGTGGISQAFADGRYTQKTANLSDLASAPTARTNLGLGTAATQPSTAFDAAGAATAAQAASLQKASNLSDLANAGTARTNLGLGTAATQASTAFDAAGAASAAQAASLQKASNLSDLADVPTARTNLGLGSAATQASSAFDAAGAASSAQAASLQKASNLSDVANAGTARTNLGAAATVHTHAESDVTGLVTDLAGKAAVVHTHNVVFDLSAFSKSGVLTTGAGVSRLPIGAAYTIQSVRAMVGTAPTGAAILVDVNKNGTTIFTTQGNRPSIAAAGNASSAAVPDVTSLAAGDFLTVDVDQIGSTVAGSDLTVIVTVSRVTS
jgi:hypothetical protein